MNTTTFTKDDEVVATHDIPMFGAFINRGTRGKVVRYYDEDIFATGASWIVDFEGHNVYVRVFEEEIERVETPRVVSEETEEYYFVQAEKIRRDEGTDWVPWQTGDDITSEQSARDAMAGLTPNESVVAFRVVKITTTTVIEAL